VITRGFMRFAGDMPQEMKTVRFVKHATKISVLSFSMIHTQQKRHNSCLYLYKR
jgi:hypothetical protein